MPEDSFGLRLRRERERRHIPLSSISANTKISTSLFEGLERDDVSRWPTGIFRRSFFRAYAHAIGVDVESMTREFLERFPDPELAPPTPPTDELRGDSKRRGIVVTVRVPRWLTTVRPWSRVLRAGR